MRPRFNWRHQYDTARDEKEGELSALTCEGESLTQQSFTNDANINVIARRFGLDGIPTAPLDPRLFRDTTNDPELREILDAQRDARDAFLSLPAKLRRRFHNSPEELWQFLTDPENSEEAVRLGLLRESPADPPAPPARTETPPGGETTPQVDKKTEGAPKAP